MRSFLKFIIFAHLFVLVVSARGYGYNPPAVAFPSPQREYPTIGCNPCRPTTQCVSELEVRDENVPKEVPIPTIDYQIRWEAKPVQVVTDFDVRDNPCPIVVPLQDKEVRVEPRIREVEKIVTVRVPRVRENVVVKRLDRVKLIPQVQTKAKPIYVQHVRQVPAPVKRPVPKTVIQKKYTPEVKEVPVPVRIANIVDVTVNRIDKPVELPSIRFQFCEKVQEIQVKANCPTVTPDPSKPLRVIGEGLTDYQHTVGHSWNRQRRDDADEESS